MAMEENYKRLNLHTLISIYFTLLELIIFVTTCFLSY